MRRHHRWAKWATLAFGSLILIAGIVWGVDFLIWHAKPEAQRYAQFRVDQLYTVENRYNETEWSRGAPVMERCTNSWLPQQGMRPCWYVKEHQMHVNAL
jgi:hypothetical protein